MNGTLVFVLNTLVLCGIVASAIVAAISLLLTLTVHLSIRNGIRNVEAILHSLS